MESVFSRFDAYDFAADRRFRDGLTVFRESGSSSSSSGDGDKLLDMKLFYYNRFVEPIDPSSYKRRSSSASRRVTDPDPDPDPEPEPGPGAETEVKQLSFAEVMRLVQEGKEVPGAKTLDVRPSNRSPTPTQLERKPKPWETASAHK